MRRFVQVDVFTDVPFLGNPVAVVLDADGMTDAQMQRFANWTNLSETTFVLPPTTPEADYRVRIFTPDEELPFAGHPTLGTCHAWLADCGRGTENGTVMQECQAGLVRIKRDGGRLAFAAPPRVRSGPADAAMRAHVAAMLNLDAGQIVGVEWADNGPGWVAVQVTDAQTVLDVRPGKVDMSVGVVGLYPPGGPADIEVRALYASGDLVIEDPVTGSLNASVAQWLLGNGTLTAPYLSRQGTVLGRAGQVYVTRDDDQTIWVGGGTITCVRGEADV